MFSLNFKRNMATTPKVVLLACGSFNPVTHMHLRMFGKSDFLHILVLIPMVQAEGKCQNKNLSL